MKSYLHRLANYQSGQDLWEAHTDKMADYRSGVSLGDPEDFVILTNHDQDYMNVFIGEQHYLNAPMVNWALNNVGAGSWSVLGEMRKAETLTPQELRVLAFNVSMGVKAGYTISFKAISARSKGAIALTAREGMSQDEVDAMWDEHGNDIQLMNNIAHLKILTLPYVSPKRVLTRRQREALE